MQAVNLLNRRYDQLVVVLTNFYMTHPDAEVFSVDYRKSLAKCMSAKITYGVTYDEDIELVLRRMNQWHASAAVNDQDED